MGQMVFEPDQSWHLGAHVTPAQDLGPKGSFALGENTQLLNNTGASAVIGQREGWALQNPTPVTDSSAILGMYDYIRATSNLTRTSYHLVVEANGRLDVLLPDRTLASADAVRPAPFTPGFYPPSFATMNNLCFIANGKDSLKVFNGTKVWDAGLVAPTAPVLGVGPAGSFPAGTYSVVVTYYDATSGTESSASPETEGTLAAGYSLAVSWPAYTGTHPWTHTRVYVRQNAKQTEHFLVHAAMGGDPNGVPAPGTLFYINLTQDQLDALTILAPDEDENDPPPVGIIGVEAHVSRLFLHDGSKVYYSNLGKPEAFDPDNFFLVNTDDGQKITALHAAHEVLIVFKRDSVWALYGEDPSTWTPRMISPSVGCINERSVLFVEGTSYWWSEAGPMSWAGTGPVEALARGRIDELVALDKAIHTKLAFPNVENEAVGIVGVIDVLNQRLLWAVPQIGKHQNNIIFPYKYKFNQWEATSWFGLDAASLASVQDASSTPYVFLGGYQGQIFRYGGVYNDGTPPGLQQPDGRITGLVEGTVVSGTLNTLTIDATLGDLLTEGGGLKERYLFANEPGLERWQIKRIGSNTLDTITLAQGEEFTLIPQAGWLWQVGTIGFRVQLPWQSFSAPFIRKRLEYGYFWVGSSVGGTELEAGLFRNYDLDDLVRYFYLPLGSTGLVWNQGNWDQEVWGAGISATRYRKRLAKVCFIYKWTFRQYRPNTDAVIYKIDTRGETQVDKT